MILRCLRQCLHTSPMQQRKFYPGQGGKIQFQLNHGRYQIHLQTIWEDYAEMEVAGGVVAIDQTSSKIILTDKQMKNQKELVRISLKIPIDYTLDGFIRGKLQFIKGAVDTKLRSQPYSLRSIGQDAVLSLPSSSSQTVNLSSQKLLELGSLTCTIGRIQAHQITAKKIMLSKSLQIIGEKVNLRSLINFGEGKSKIKSKELQIQSLSGDSRIESPKISIDRLYGGSNIQIITTKILRKMKIETGSGRITFPDEIDAFEAFKMLQLGRMHKGNLQLKTNKIIVTN